MVMDEISLARARQIATKKGLKPGRIKGTYGIQFTRGRNNSMEIIDWDDFEQILQTRKLAIYESAGWMKIMKKK